MEVFNEQTLRAEIAKIWGEHGAHIEVYDMLLKRANVVLPQANVIKSLPSDKEIENFAKIEYPYCTTLQNADEDVSMTAQELSDRENDCHREGFINGFKRGNVL